MSNGNVGWCVWNYNKSGERICSSIVYIITLQYTKLDRTQQLGCLFHHHEGNFECGLFYLLMMIMTIQNKLLMLKWQLIKAWSVNLDSLSFIAPAIILVAIIAVAGILIFRNKRSARNSQIVAPNKSQVKLFQVWSLFVLKRLRIWCGLFVSPRNHQNYRWYCFETTSARIGAAAAHSMP